MGKKVLVFLALCSLLVSSVFAENDSVLDESFDIMAVGLPEGIIPPSIPDTTTAAKNNIGQPANVLISMQDIETGEFLSNVHVNYVIKNNGHDSMLQYVGEEGYLELYLDPGNYDVVLKIHKLDTDGYDYFAEGIIVVDEFFNQTFNAFPAGSVRGTVSSKKGTLISGAVLKFECSKQYGDFSDMTTNDVGSYSRNALPAGRCIITASNNGMVGSEEVNIEKGALINVDIILSSSVTGVFVMSWIFWLIIIVVLVAAGTDFYIMHKQKTPEEEKAEKKEETIENKIAATSENSEEETKPDIPKRSLDILKTLNAREREIVQFLLECKDPCLQNKIVHNTGIPKTSIVRIFENLESKNIITVKKVGKAKKIALTAWFLEKE